MHMFSQLTMVILQFPRLFLFTEAWKCDYVSFRVRAQERILHGGNFSSKLHISPPLRDNKSYRQLFMYTTLVILILYSRKFIHSALWLTSLNLHIVFLTWNLSICTHTKFVAEMPFFFLRSKKNITSFFHIHKACRLVEEDVNLSSQDSTVSWVGLRVSIHVGHSPTRF